VIWDRRIFLTGGDAQVREVYCFDRETGKRLWTSRAENIEGSPPVVPETTSDTGLAAPTAATDGVRVYAIFGTGDLLCLDMDGKRVWARNMGVPNNHYGHSSSLLVFGNLLIVQLDDNEDARVMGLAVSTGKTVWETGREMISWSSPICVDTGERMEVILTDGEFASSYNPLNGEELWQVSCLDGEVGPSAAYGGGLVFVANEYAVASAIRAGDVGAAGGSRIAWQWDGELPSVASPVTDGKLVFLASSAGVITCLDAGSGEVRWSREFDDGFYSSPVMVGDRVYALDKAGLMHVFRADEQYELMAEPAIGEACFSTPAFVGRRIYIRGEKHLFCVGGKSEDLDGG